ncbi:MazG nucleotide pyrophosphohydrolase domain-containing protein [Rhizobium rhizosphaerae]|uniref:MazG nucleotide pyrophosphohydrolase domain-containing protein n=1 Tax=Xaviernesmea rhizosphaerae TaxID=1672749 RepID=UPI00117A136B|nr:MazG nucleotide pyrophosphohydrolase domain-containing protein [Xaviernesmea rhizosphaerae]
MEVERGFSRQTALEKCLLLGEELGELFKAVRRQTGMPIEGGAAALAVADELADMLIYLCAIANRHGISLEEALRANEARNATREWRPAVSA